MLPDFNRLRTFFHVHRAGSVSGAAAALHVTQSAVSQSLAKLEDELGAPLFVRRHRALAPTAAGEALYSVVAPFVAALQGGVEQLHRARDELVGTLRVGAPVEFGARRLAPALAGFTAAHPGVRFTLTLGHPSQVVPMLEEGRLDLAFADLLDTPPSRLAGLDITDVADETLLLVATPALERTLLQGGRGFARLAAARYVDYHPGAPAVRGWFRHHFGRVPARIDLALAVESVQAVLAAAQHGMGLALVPEPAARAALAAGELVAVAGRRRALTNRISLLRPPGRVPARAEKAFVAHVVPRLARPAG
jgi:DNA-binding transcriptional LysR family regulator